MEIGLTALGLMAGALTSSSYIPQVFRAWRTRETNDFSWWMLVILFAGSILWLAYGAALEQMAMIITNTLSCLLVFSLIVLKKFRG